MLDLEQELAVPGLRAFLDTVRDELMVAIDSSTAAVTEPAARVTSASGKLLRPAFVAAAGAAASPQPGKVFDAPLNRRRLLDAAVAVELVQVGSLVHDDLFEGAATRRGVPTINSQEGPSMALMVGAFVLARAGGYAARVSPAAAAMLARTVEALCVGQLTESHTLGDPGRTLANYRRSIEGKTASLFACSAALGAMACGSEGTAAIAEYGRQFGFAFQILDDVLDLVADESRLGKPVGIDLATGVFTLPVLLTLTGPTGPQLLALIDQGDTAAAVAHVAQSEAIDRSVEEAYRCCAAAAEAAAALAPSPTRDALARFPAAYLDWALGHFAGR